MKRIIVLVLAIVLVAAMFQSVFAGDRNYRGRGRGNVVGTAVAVGAIVALTTILLADRNIRHSHSSYPVHRGYRRPNFPPYREAYCIPYSPGCRLYVQPGGWELWLPH